MTTTDTAFARASVPDLEEDFEGCLQALAERYLAAIESLGPRQFEDHHLDHSAHHLARMIELKAPDVILDLAERTLMRRLRKRPAARRVRERASLDAA